MEKVSQLNPDVVILDIRMPILNGLEAATQILHSNPCQKIAVLSFTDAEQVVKEVLKAGVKAYILKSDAALELIAAVEALQKNKPYFNRRVQELRTAWVFQRRGSLAEGINSQSVDKSGK